MSRILTQDGKPVVSEVIYAESPGARLRGLLGCSGLAAGSGMLIRPCRSIHMWFMRFSIDAAFLDGEMRVLKIARNLHPWQMALAPRRTHCVLETAAGGLAELQPGDTLAIE